jgi:hypothetical protein
VRRPVFAAVLLVAPIAASSSCARGTEVTLDIRTNAPCERVRGAVVRMSRAAADLPAAGVIATRDGCTAGGGDVGTLTIVPSGVDDAEIAVQVTLGLGRDPRSCSPDDRAGCVVARRALRFVPGKSTRLLIEMDALCEGRACAAEETCEKDRCVGIPGLPVDALPAEPDAAAGDVGADAAPVTCEQVCPQKAGTCIDGVCEIACKGGDKCSGNATLCPSGVPCRIVCSEPSRGKPACRNIMCPTDVPRCEIVCEGGGACADALTCEAPLQCSVKCVTANACKGASVNVEAADNVITCVAKDACKEANLACQPPGEPSPRNCRQKAATCAAPPCKCTDDGKPCGPP